MKNMLLCLTLLLVMLFLLVSNDDAQGHRNSAMNLECASCHLEGPPAKIIIKGIPAKFQPGKAYQVTVEVVAKLKSLSESKGGFAVQASAGTLKVKDEKRTQILGDYLTHTPEGNKVRKWTFLWIAPTVEEEAIITVMGVAANGDYAPCGDAVAADAVVSKKAMDKSKK
ncbi:MAG: choice-of-anchor V domain-containing protein [Caldimicrobium sp.]|nr:hypothetical protein [Caldimicrobium sp.]MDW8182270.1 choice-of-anchor V domain-containing protein [Caldimicrobium sp.]